MFSFTWCCVGSYQQITYQLEILSVGPSVLMWNTPGWSLKVKINVLMLHISNVLLYNEFLFCYSSADKISIWYVTYLRAFNHIGMILQDAPRTVIRTDRRADGWYRRKGTAEGKTDRRTEDGGTYWFLETAALFKTLKRKG